MSLPLHKRVVFSSGSQDYIVLLQWTDNDLSCVKTSTSEMSKGFCRNDVESVYRYYVLKYI